ncbi:complement regulator-acquiring protein [Borreliella tanukii]|uniref:complement regulator-acquiring protein n=1 Tax=Borreliella tanukii TaxID=56146 RepID=UPI0026473CFB|nr:complement regulator-acquiring protein [Borreliella tanukii]WKC82172.1 complement regulator-acquiring protein [Borreliella tanukii]
MTKTKLNLIKLNIITTILTLICNSCAPFNEINLEEINIQGFKNESSESEDLGYSYQRYQELKLELEKSQGNTASKLEIIKKHLEAEKTYEDMQIAKIATESDFLKTFQINADYATISENQRIAIKRMIYSSLNYNAEKVKILKEILEKLNENSHHNIIVKNFLYHIAMDIQLKLERDLKSIKEEGFTELSMPGLSVLRLKEGFIILLNKTIDDYNNNVDNIKTDVNNLAKYMHEKYKDLNFAHAPNSIRH